MTSGPEFEEACKSDREKTTDAPKIQAALSAVILLQHQAVYSDPETRTSLAPMLKMLNYE
jgi:hypothetical protein